jgi:hypothetical protein
VGIVKHSVTHHAITLHGVCVTNFVEDAIPLDCAELTWVPLSKAAELAVSSPQKSLMQQMNGRLNA